MKKTINLPTKLHEQLKIQAAKEHCTIEALASRMLWEKLGGVHHG